MTYAKFNFNQLMLSLIFGIWASEPPRAWRTTEKAGPDRVKSDKHLKIVQNVQTCLINVSKEPNAKNVTCY